MNGNQAVEAVIKAKSRLGSRLVVLAHHYQCDEIVGLADYVGDSLELARRASRASPAEYIVLCGVSFMAETASILAPGKKVLIPVRNAGCPLADSAHIKDVERAWETITRASPSAIPVTYVNSSAQIKAFCGRNGGAVCTSANAAKVVSWALERAKRVFFLPDMNLGMNTARSIGMSDEEVLLWDGGAEAGGSADDAVADARLILWKGWCPVHHGVFTAADIRELLQRYPGIRVVMHPEVDPLAVEEAGEAGSTSQMLALLEGLPPGSLIALGTETTLVMRAAKKMQERGVTVIPARKSFCSDMAKITPEALAWLLSHLDDTAHMVAVPEDVARDARKALDVMLEL